MTRILLRAGKDPFDVIPAYDRRAWHKGGFFSTNTGNLLFADSVHRLLSVPGTDVEANRFAQERTAPTPAEAARINATYDAFVIPLANALRRGFEASLERLSDLIEQLRIPVVIAGIGGQFKLEDSPNPTMGADIEEIHRRFVRAVLARSPRIGVRGEVTARYLRRLGFGDNVIDVVGCPSLYLFSDTLRVRDERAAGPLRTDDRVALTLGTTGRPEFLPFLDRAVAEFPKLVYIGQREYDLALLQWGRDPDPALGIDPRYPAYRDHVLYREDRMRLFLDTRTWVEYLRDYRFSVGSRLHGSVAAILAGTPAHIIVHDSRTFEVAEHHAIPYTTLPALRDDTGVADLFEATDYTAFGERFAAGWETLNRLFADAGIPTIAATPNPAYDERVAATRFAPAVETLRAPGEEGIRRVEDRINALQQAMAAESEQARLRLQALERHARDAGGPSLAGRVRHRLARKPS